MKRRSFLRIMGGGVIFAALPSINACSSALPKEVIAAWQHPSENLDVRKWILSYAILAPHSHNLQSWLVDLSTPDQITLYCDQTRLLPMTDPYARQIVVSQGTFIELLDMAAKERGLRANIELFPKGSFGPEKVDNRPTATIRLVKAAGVEKDPLFPQILKRHTNREPYEMKDPAPDALRSISDSVANYPVEVGFVDSGQSELVEQHRAIAAEGWRIELTTPRTILETYKVLRIGPTEIAKHRDGVSINDPFLRLITAVGLFDRTKAPAPDDSAVTGQIEEFSETLNKTPSFFWLVTDGNDRITQINAGRAYVRAQLAATANGLSMHPISQALQEFSEMQTPYTQIHQLIGVTPPRQVVQMWTRLGYGPMIEPSPRRGVAEHVLDG